MRTRIWRRALAAAGVALIISTTAVYAVDNLDVDGDGLAPVVNNTLAFGNVCPGDEISADAAMWISMANANTTNDFANSAVVTVTRGTVNDQGVNGDLSAPASVGTINLPIDWNTTRVAGNHSDAVTSTVTLSVAIGAVATSYNGSVQYSAAGNKLGGGSLTRSHDLAVTWTVLQSNDAACAAGNTAPEIGVDNASVTVTEGSTATNSGTFSDADGDVVTLTASVGTVIDNLDGTWSWSWGTTDGPADSQTVTITADDGTDTTDATFALTVLNANPVASLTCPTDPVAVGTSVTLGGSFTDAGVLDTHTATIDWNDGTGALGATVSESGGSGTATGMHTYTAAGIYSPTLVVTDKDSGIGSSTCMYVVVYDPSAGFVTGGGWIWSPAGAYVLDDAVVGKATFGFVSKYKKGATVPDGNTEFQFNAAGLNFKSTSYQWLVVSGSKATYKGFGNLNGVSGYGFLLSAVDGSPDMFRIKIWLIGGDVVYDNNLGGGDDAAPATALSGGSIVVHTK